MASQIDKYTILYGRLSQEDARMGDSNSIINQDEICQGDFPQKNTALKKFTKKQLNRCNFRPV